MFHKNDLKAVSKEQAAFLSRIQKRKTAVLALQIILLISFFLLWEIAARQ